MSIILRSLLRDPKVTRPLSRAMRRFDDDWFLEDWPARKIRRSSPVYESPVALMDEMNHHLATAMNRMQEDIEALDEIVGRNWYQENSQAKRKKRGIETIVKRTESGGLQLALDVNGYKPEELKIKLVDDNLVVEAISESSGEDSYHRNHFKRWFKLPEDCKVEEIKSKLTNDNRLLIDLPSDKPLEQKTRSIPIEMEMEKSSPTEKIESNQEAKSSQSNN